VRTLGWLIGRGFAEVLRSAEPADIGRFSIGSFFTTTLESCFPFFPRGVAIGVGASSDSSSGAGDDGGAGEDGGGSGC
jgi:hypothetical protein